MEVEEAAAALGGGCRRERSMMWSMMSGGALFTTHLHSGCENPLYYCVLTSSLLRGNLFATYLHSGCVVKSNPTWLSLKSCCWKKF